MKLSLSIADARVTISGDNLHVEFQAQEMAIAVERHIEGSDRELDGRWSDPLPNHSSSSEHPAPRQVVEDEGRPAALTSSQSSLPVATNSPQPNDAPKPAAVAIAVDAIPHEASAAPIRRSARDWRPHCQEPEACASYRREHCHTCARAAGINSSESSVGGVHVGSVLRKPVDGKGDAEGRRTTDIDAPGVSGMDGDRPAGMVAAA